MKFMPGTAFLPRRQHYDCTIEQVRDRPPCQLSGPAHQGAHGMRANMSRARPQKAHNKHAAATLNRSVQSGRSLATGQIS